MVGYTSYNSIAGFPKVGYSMLLSNGRPLLGGGIQGFIPPPLSDTDNGDEGAQTRSILVESWNNTKSGLGITATRRAQTPFRAANNAGDILSRQYYSCGRQNQCFQSRPGLRGLKLHCGSASNNCDDSGLVAATCNVKYVYDGSDYTRFKKQFAIKQNYNLYTNGGNNSSGSQSALRRVRGSRL